MEGSYNNRAKMSTFRFHEASSKDSTNQYSKLIVTGHIPVEYLWQETAVITRG
jgi:hypothetical protein